MNSKQNFLKACMLGLSILLSPITALHAQDDDAEKRAVAIRDAKIRENLEAFPQVEVKKDEKSGRAIPFQFKVNGENAFVHEGNRYSGFRFVVDRGQKKDEVPHDMVWFFLTPNISGFNRWFITGTEKSLERGFTHFRRFSNRGVSEEWPPEPGKRGLILYQPLSGNKLVEGKEYIIWFSFKEDDVKEYELTASIGYMASGFDDIKALTHLGLNN